MTYEIRIKVIDHTSSRLGRHVEHDERSRMYAVPAVGAAPPPVKWDSHIPILDQGNVGACTGFATIGALGHDPYYAALSANHPVLDDVEARAIYHVATTLDNIPGDWPPDDTGSTGLAASKAAVQAGFISGYRSVFSVDALKTALQSGPVIVGTDWYNSMFDPGASGLVSVDFNSGIAGGHEYVCDELTADGRFGFKNSWGISWGDSGRFYITVDQFTQLLQADGDAILFTPLTQPAPTPTPPPPAPTPAPVPPVVDADVKAAFDALKKWAARNGV